MSRRLRKKSNAKDSLSSFFPQYNSQFVMPMHLRYESSTASTTSVIYPFALLNSLAVGSGANAIYRIFQAIRLKRVELRGISSAVNKITTISLTWSGPTDPFKEITCSGNTERPFSITTSPSPNSTTGFWYGATSLVGSLFTIVTDGDFGEAQCDIYFDALFYDAGSASSKGGLTSAGTAGALYTPALDSTTDGSTWNGTPRWLPVGRTTIA